MAPGMKRWIGMVGVGITLLAIWKLPPEVAWSNAPEVVPAERLRASRLQTEVSTTAETLRRVLWSDSLAPLVAGGPEVSLLLHDRGGSIPESQRTLLERRLRIELEAIGGDGGMRFGYIFQPHDQSRTAGMPNSFRDRVETFVGTEDGVAYCMQLRVHRAGRLASIIERRLVGARGFAPATTGMVGACGTYLRYGHPGARVQEWLESGGIKFAARRGTRDSRAYDRGRRSFLGSSVVRWQDRPIQSDQCLAGDPDACEYLFLTPSAADPPLGRGLDIVRRSPAVSIGTPSGYRSIIFDEPYLLADLAEEFGAEAFATFWTSDASLPEAFEAAFGTAPGPWLLTWIAASVDIDAPGPGLPRSATSGSMLTIALLLGIAWSVQRRRKVA